MRTLAVAALTGLVALMVASTASAAPSFSLLFTGTTGTGATGSSSIDAQVGDTLTVDVLLSSDVNVVGWSFGLFGGSAAAGVSGVECPAGISSGSNNNFALGNCFSGAGVFAPLVTGVTVSGSDLLNYDGGQLQAAGLPIFGTMWVGTAVFTVTGAGDITLAANPGPDPNTIALPGGGGAVIGGSATIVPEPGTMGLMGLGMAALGLAGRRRK